MSDVAIDPGSAADLAAVLDRDVLQRAVAEAVLGHAGVERIEPTLLGAVKALRQGGDPAADVRVVTRGRLTDVTVHVAVRSDHQARLLAHRLRASIAATVEAAGGVPGHLDVSVLAIEAV